MRKESKGRRGRNGRGRAPSYEPVERMSPQSKAFGSPRGKGNYYNKPERKPVFSKIKDMGRGKNQRRGERSPRYKSRTSPSKVGGRWDDAPYKSSATPSKVGGRRGGTPLIIVSERHNNNPSIISERRNNEPNTTLDFTENKDKKPKLTPLTKEQNDKSTQSNRTTTRRNITRHNMTTAQTPPNNRDTETLEIIPLRSNNKDSIVVINPDELSRSGLQDNIVKHNIAKIETSPYKSDTGSGETTPLLVKSMG